MKNVIEAITEAIKLADRVESLSHKVTEIAKAHREDAKELRRDLHELDKRVVKIEALVAFTQKSLQQPPPASSKKGVKRVD
jgi:Mg2+ and Co2+ transporter CorA